MDPRDPRNAPPDPPLVAPRRNDEDYGPVAPKPEWETPPRAYFNRERFLLRCVAWIIGVQFGIFALGGVACVYGALFKLKAFPREERADTLCPKIGDRLQDATDSGLAILLALLGGGAVAVGEYQRRHPPERPSPPLDPRDPRR